MEADKPPGEDFFAADLPGFRRIKIEPLSFRAERGICCLVKARHKPLAKAVGMYSWGSVSAICARIAGVTFDRESIEARLALNRIGSSDMPKIACDALEAGMDGPGIRRLAALDSPTYFEVRDVLPRAMQEMGLAELSRGVAALRVAKNCAKQILGTS